MDDATQPSGSPRPAGHIPVVLSIAAPADIDEVPQLCARLRAALLRTDAEIAICDVSAFERVDVDALDAMARVQLTARELGREVWFRHASRPLRVLLELSGLSETLRTLDGTDPLPPRS